MLLSLLTKSLQHSHTTQACRFGGWAGGDRLFWLRPTSKNAPRSKIGSEPSARLPRLNKVTFIVNVNSSIPSQGQNPAPPAIAARCSVPCDKDARRSRAGGSCHYNFSESTGVRFSPDGYGGSEGPPSSPQSPPRIWVPSHARRVEKFSKVPPEVRQSIRVLVVVTQC